MKLSHKLMSIFLFYVFVTFSLFNQLSAQTKSTYYKIKIDNPTKQIVMALSSAGIPLEDGYFDKKNNALEVYVNDRDLGKLNERNITFTIIINDVEKYYADKLKLGEKEFLKSKLDVLPKGFVYGTMGGYPKLLEYIRMIDTMNIMYPNLASQKISIGKTSEGREIYLIKITGQKNTNVEKKKVLYTGLHHAREGPSITTLLYYMFYILENYGKDSVITYLIDNREMYFVPLVNPDGYAYNQLTNPNGGGMWRKNRSLWNNIPEGVDLNRNYGYKWGYDNTGSSSYYYDDTYRGKSAFSELETSAIRQLCKQNKFITAINHHTYSNLIVYPWGYENKETLDSGYYRFYSKEMSKYNGYQIGTSLETVGYFTNGDSDDWMYGEQTEKNKIIALTFESGGNSDGFWASKNRIVPIAQENLNPNLLFAKIADAYIETANISADSAVGIGDTVNIRINFKNLGLLTAENIKVNIIFSDPMLLANNGSINLLNVPSFKTIDTNISFGLTWKPTTPLGYAANYSLTLSYNGIPVTKQLKLIRGINKPVEYLSYNIKQEGNRVTLFWTTLSEENNSRFYIERMFSQDGLVGGYQQIGSIPGAGNSNKQINYSYIDTIPTLTFQNKPISYYYRLRTADKNSKNKYSDIISAILNPGFPENYYLAQNFPNPFNPITTIEYGIPENGNVSIKLFDILGREVKTLINEFKTKGRYRITLSSNDLSSEIYFYIIRINNFSEIKRMVILR